MDEQELLRLNAQIREAEAAEASARTGADALLARYRGEGVDLLHADHADKLAEVNQAYVAVDANRERSANLRAMRDREVGNQVERAAEGRKDEAVTVALRFLASEEYSRLRSSGKLRNGRIDTDPVDVMERDAFLEALRIRLFDNSAGVGSGLLVPQYTGKLVEQLKRRVRLLDVITLGRTDTDTVDWIVENARTDNAAETAFGTALPSSDYGFSHQQTTVKRAGHFLTATRGALADAGQARTLIDARLMSGLERRIESQLLSGDNVGENLKGLTTYSLTTQAKGTDTQLDCIHKAMTVIRIACESQVEPEHILIHPTDYEAVVLAKDANGNYQFGRPDTNNQPSIWGLTPVVTTLASTGTPIVGDFAEAMTAWIREGVAVSATDTHSDYWTKGLVAVKAETRLAAAVTRTAAVVKITGF